MPALIFGPSRHLVYGVQNGCASVEDLCIYKIIHSYPSPYELNRFLNMFVPKIVFLELSSGETAFPLAREIRNSFPEAVVIGFLHDCTREKAIEALDAGVAEILMPPLTDEDFSEAIIQVLNREQAEPPENLFAFLPAKAGSGSTTVALNVAGTLARVWKQRVLVLDGDLQSGIISLLMNVDPPATMLDALEIAHQLDEQHWEKIRASAHGLDLLTTPRQGKPATFSHLSYYRFFRFLRARYDTVIVDLPEIANEVTDAIVKQAKDFFVVSTPDDAALFLARRRVMELRGRGVSRTRLNVVVNRHVRDDPAVLQLEKTLERRVAAVLPRDDAAIRKATRAQELADPASEFVAATRTLARTITGLEPTAQPATAQVEQSLLDILFGRKRATAQ